MLDFHDDECWPVVGQAPVEELMMAFDVPTLRALRTGDDIGAKILGSGIVMDLLDACLGLKPWDRFADPRYLNGLLVAPDRKPQTIVLKRDASGGGGRS
jgi:hypothetical protein